MESIWPKCLYKSPCSPRKLPNLSFNLAAYPAFRLKDWPFGVDRKCCFDRGTHKVCATRLLFLRDIFRVRLFFLLLLSCRPLFVGLCMEPEPRCCVPKKDLISRRSHIYFCVAAPPSLFPIYFLPWARPCRIHNMDRIHECLQSRHVSNTQHCACIWIGTSGRKADRKKLADDGRVWSGKKPERRDEYLWLRRYEWRCDRNIRSISSIHYE